MIEIQNLYKSYGGKAVLQGISVRVQQGEVIVLIGPSGSGKSTLLRCINGLESFERGRIQVEDLHLDPEMFANGGSQRTLRQVRLKVGMVFQSFNLFPHLTALQNVTLAPLRVLGRPREEAEEKARTLLRRVNLQGKEGQYPRSLSGGEQQRVAIARALAMNPAAMLFDEPTSALDPELVGEVLSVIADLAAQGYTMMIVTHHMQFARRSANRVLFLDSGQIAEEATPAAFFDNPQSRRAQDFLRSL